MLKLDFTIVSSTDRSELVNDFFTQNPTYKPTAHELETITNYILYGKDPDGTSIVDRKEMKLTQNMEVIKKDSPNHWTALLRLLDLTKIQFVRKIYIRK